MGMSDGLVAVYSLMDDMPVEGETYLCSHTLNMTMFGMEDSDPRQRPYPVRSMVLVHSGSQVGIDISICRYIKMYLFIYLDILIYFNIPVYHNVQ